MATTNKKLVEGALLTAAVATYYAAPALTSTLLKKVTVTNSTASVQVLTLYLVPAAGAAAATNIVTSAKSIAAGVTYEAYEAENHVLMPGDSLQAMAAAASALTLQVSGIEIV